MSDRAYQPVRPSRLPFIAIVLLLVAIGVGIYATQTAGQSAKRVKLALITWNEDPFWDPVIQGAQDAAQDANAELTVVQSKADVETQNGHVKDLLSQGVQGIAISPNDPKAQTEMLNQASLKGPVITFDVDAPESGRRIFVGIDNYSAGHFAADEVRDAIPDGGAVIVTVGSIDQPHGRDRRQGVIDGLLDRSYKPGANNDPAGATLTGAKYSVVATVLDNAESAKATSMLVDALKAHPETKCIVGLYSYSGGAALNAIDQVGKHGQIKVIAFDDADATQAGIEDGTIAASILQDTYRVGQEAVRLLAEEVRASAQKGPAGPRVVNVEISFLRKDNIDLFRDSKRIRTPKGMATTKPA